MNHQKILKTKMSKRLIISSFSCQENLFIRSSFKLRLGYFLYLYKNLPLYESSKIINKKNFYLESIERSIDIIKRHLQELRELR